MISPSPRDAMISVYRLYKADTVVTPYGVQHVFYSYSVFYSVLISTEYTLLCHMLDDLPCDVHYDAKPALSIPSKLSVPRIRRYWFVLVRTDTYLPYCIIPYHTIPYGVVTYSSRDRIQPQLF